MIDNAARNDFILLVFNQAVNLASAKLTPFGQDGQAPDNDASMRRRLTATLRLA